MRGAGKVAAVWTALAIAASGGCSGGGGGGGGGGKNEQPEPQVPGGPSLEDCTTAPLRTTGTVYYFCDCQAGADSHCQAGDDAAAGTSPSAPRRTFAEARAQFLAMNGGDTVALCRGGAWNDDGGMFQQRKCSAAATCDLRDYVAPGWGSASMARPRINASAGATVIRLTPDEAAAGYRFWNLDIRTPISDQGGGIFFAYNDKRDIDVCNVRFEGSYLHVNLDPNKTATPADAHITIRKSQFYSSHFSAFLGGNSGLVIDGCTFENNGLGGWNQMHSIYLNGAPPGIVAPRITNNDIVEGDYCKGVMLVLHEQIQDPLVENNRVTTTSTSDQCYGIQSAGSWAAANVVRAIYRRNRVTTGGADAMEVSACQDCQVVSNVLVNGRLTVGSTVSDATPATSGTVVLNNTIYGSTVSFGFQSATVNNRALDSTYRNNAVFTDAAACVAMNDSTFAANDHNYCRSAEGVAASAVFAAPASGNFKPAAGGPLLGMAAPGSFAAIGIGAVDWGAADPGATRSDPDVGAFTR